MRTFFTLLISFIGVMILPWWLVLVAIGIVSVAFELPFLFVFTCMLYLGVVEIHFIVLPIVILVGYAIVTILSKHLSFDLGRF